MWKLKQKLKEKKKNLATGIFRRIVNDRRWINGVELA